MQCRRVLYGPPASALELVSSCLSSCNSIPQQLPLQLQLAAWPLVLVSNSSVQVLPLDPLAARHDGDLELKGWPRSAKRAACSVKLGKRVKVKHKRARARRT
jgi:hypothetical protein